MGVYISGWHLARAVSLPKSFVFFWRCVSWILNIFGKSYIYGGGQLGTVSGVALHRIVPRILQMGDPGGHIRRALSHFPFPAIARKVIEAFYVEGGIKKGTPFKAVPIFTINPTHLLICTTICSNYAFVWLAKEKNPNPISINYLEKVAMPHVYAIFGAILAGVDFITMGAGIPLQIPKLIEDIVEGREATYRIPVIGKNITSYTMTFDAKKFFGSELPKMKKPGFIPIISSNLLANIFMKKLPPGSVFGFVVEEPTAGGHNAPPRKPIFDENGEPEPIYGEKDVVDYPTLASLGVPFWIGGSYASPEKLKWALSVGATGIQAGSIFALSEDSNMDPNIRKKIRKHGFEGTLIVKTDMRISPTSFPFKVVELEDTISKSEVYEARTRICNQSELVSLYERPDGKIGYRCSAEPVDQYVRKGGDPADTVGRGCLCNGLITTAELGNEEEPPVVTLGDDVSFLPFLMKNTEDSYSADEAIKYLLN